MGAQFLPPMAIFFGYCSEIFIILSTYVTFFLVPAATLASRSTMVRFFFVSSQCFWCFRCDLTILFFITEEGEKLVQLETIP